MKEFGILMRADGPNHNVLKIKPPLTFTKENADAVLFYLQKIVAEEGMKIG
jgi:4-aminobutyrate aminotransferase-like enzyme